MRGMYGVHSLPFVIPDGRFFCVACIGFCVIYVHFKHSKSNNMWEKAFLASEQFMWALSFKKTIDNKIFASIPFDMVFMRTFTNRRNCIRETCRVTCLVDGLTR